MNRDTFLPNIIELFPTPVYIGNVPIKFKSLVKFFDAQKITNNKDRGSDAFGNRSLDTYILNKKECVDFSNYILNLAFYFGNELGYQYEKYQFSQSWISWKHPNQEHVRHTHSNSLLSGVFYYGNYSKPISNIEFHKPQDTFGLSLSPKWKFNPDFKHSYPSVNIPIKSGLIIIFPSNLIHSVSKNMSKDIRKSLSFNILPVGMLGDPNDLTGLKL